MTMLVPILERVIFYSGWFVLVYYLLVNGIYLMVQVAGLAHLRDDLKRKRWGPMMQPFESAFVPGIAVLVPAYNEAPVIEETVQALLHLNYPDTEVIVVNDGSDDETLTRLRSTFDLVQTGTEVPFELPSEPIRGVYESETYPDLVVLDKANGGKSDALNAGLWYTEQPLFCSLDADSVIDREGLMQVVKPFLDHPEEMVATGGTVRIGNGCTIDQGEVLETKLPTSLLSELQVIEYLRAFYSGRLGLDQLNSLILISGAFGLFRTDVIRDIGGFDTASVTEDFDLVVRLHKHLSENDRPYRVAFVPEPVVWTEVPESLRILARQRRRWYRGLIETVIRHRSMIGRRRYGPSGYFGLPALVAAEGLGPLIEGAGYIIVPVSFLIGVADIEFVVLYFVLTTGVGVFLSWFGVFSEAWSFRRYDRPSQIVRLMGDGVLENFGYRQLKTFIAWHGLLEYVTGNRSWGRMTRRGFG